MNKPVAAFYARRGSRGGKRQMGMRQSRLCWNHAAGDGVSLIAQKVEPQMRKRKPSNMPLVKDRGETPAISPVQYLKLLKVLGRQGAKLEAMLRSLEANKKTDRKKLRRLVEAFDETIWRMQLDYTACGRRERIKLAQLASLLNPSNN